MPGEEPPPHLQLCGRLQRRPSGLLRQTGQYTRPIIYNSIPYLLIHLFYLHYLFIYPQVVIGGRQVARDPPQQRNVIVIGQEYSDFRDSQVGAHNHPIHAL